MIAFFLIMLFTLLYQAFLNAMVVVFHASSALFLVAPVVLVLVIFCLGMVEGLWALIFAGILIDSLTGSITGVNMVLLAFLGALGMGMSSWLGKPHWPMFVGFLCGTSLIYRLMMVQMGNWGGVNLIFGPIADACIGFLVFYLLPRRVIKMD
ncbi:MAG: hypothetical protein WCK49_04130 [Myxococcaceae bacterium]